MTCENENIYVIRIQNKSQYYTDLLLIRARRFHARSLILGASKRFCLLTNAQG